MDATLSGAISILDEETGYWYTGRITAGQVALERSIRSDVAAAMMDLAHIAGPSELAPVICHECHREVPRRSARLVTVSNDSRPAETFCTRCLADWQRAAERAAIVGNPARDAELMELTAYDDEPPY
jgi:hypothetical protein